MSKTYTRGNIVVEDIKVGDIHYEFELNLGIKVEVITLPKLNEQGQWEWKSKKSSNPDKIIQYTIDPEHTYYGPNLYDNIAYNVKHWI